MGLVSSSHNSYPKAEHAIPRTRRGNGRTYTATSHPHASEVDGRRTKAGLGVRFRGTNSHREGRQAAPSPRGMPPPRVLRGTSHAIDRTCARAFAAPTLPKNRNRQCTVRIMGGKRQENGAPLPPTRGTWTRPRLDAASIRYRVGCQPRAISLVHPLSLLWFRARSPAGTMIGHATFVAAETLRAFGAPATPLAVIADCVTSDMSRCASHASIIHELNHDTTNA